MTKKHVYMDINETNAGVIYKIKRNVVIVFHKEDRLKSIKSEKEK
jgi:hypothetical protein